MATSRLPHKILLHQHNRNRRRRVKKSSNLNTTQNSITTQPSELDVNLLDPDPFYYYDISSESESECDITFDIYDVTFLNSGVDTLMDIKELQWVCCCCGKYNSLPTSHQYITGHEVCADNACQHNPCDQCQSIETTVCRRAKHLNRELTKKEKSRVKR